jgi:hypothetical protein
MYLEQFLARSTLQTEFSLHHGSGPFTGDWAAIHWMNTPGPIYGAATDTCGTGPLIAPNNIMHDSDGQEVVFRQPVNDYELRQVLQAADADPFGGYGANGNDYWSYPLIKEWWKRHAERTALINQWYRQQLALQDTKNYPYFTGLARWKTYVQDDLYVYLQVYTFFLEKRRVPTHRDRLPVI